MSEILHMCMEWAAACDRDMLKDPSWCDALASVIEVKWDFLWVVTCDAKVALVIGVLIHTCVHLTLAD